MFAAPVWGNSENAPSWEENALPAIAWFTHGSGTKVAQLIYFAWGSPQFLGFPAPDSYGVFIQKCIRAYKLLC